MRTSADECTRWVGERIFGRVNAKWSLRFTSSVDEMRRAAGVAEPAYETPWRVLGSQRVAWLARSASITAAEMTMRPRKRSAGSSFVFTHS